jgi:hypothetical protein
MNQTHRTLLRKQDCVWRYLQSQVLSHQTKLRKTTRFGYLQPAYLHEQRDGVADLAPQQRALLVDDERLACSNGQTFTQVRSHIDWI